MEQYRINAMETNLNAKIQRRKNLWANKPDQVIRDSRDGMYYVVGYCGGRWWMKVSSGYKTRQEAQKQIHHLRRADAAMKAELSEI